MTLTDSRLATEVATALALTAHEKIGPPFSGPKLLEVVRYDTAAIVRWCSESKALILGECCDGRHRYIGWRYRHPCHTYFRIEPVRPAYIFAYTRLPARQIAPVTVVTKNANAIPIFLFVC